MCAGSPFLTTTDCRGGGLGPQALSPAEFVLFNDPKSLVNAGLCDLDGLD